MKTRHKDLTPRQVQDKVANLFFTTIILSGLIMFYIFNSIQGVYGGEMEEEIHIDAPDDNIIDSRPTPRWRLNSNGFSQRYIHLTADNRQDRIIEFIGHYGFTIDDWYAIRTIARIHQIHPEMFVCIMYADSSMGKFMKTKNNPGNVFNDDSGGRKDFETMEQGIDAIGRYALNGSYLKHKYTVDYLSPALGKPGPYYATSKENWHINVTNCLGMIHNKHIPDNWNFRQ